MYYEISYCNTIVMYYILAGLYVCHLICNSMSLDYIQGTVTFYVTFVMAFRKSSQAFLCFQDPNHWNGSHIAMPFEPHPPPELPQIPLQLLKRPQNVWGRWSICSWRMSQDIYLFRLKSIFLLLGRTILCLVCNFCKEIVIVKKTWSIKIGV